MRQTTGLLNGRVDQIALLVPDLEPAMDAYIANMGVSFRTFEVDHTTGTFSGSSAHFRIRMGVAMAGFLTVELIQPVAGVTLYSKHLESRGPGLHHVGVYVNDLGKAERSLTRRGYPTILEGEIGGLGRFAYFEVPEMHCMVEVLQLFSTVPLFLLSKAAVYRKGRAKRAQSHAGGESR